VGYCKVIGNVPAASFSKADCSLDKCRSMKSRSRSDSLDLNSRRYRLILLRCVRKRASFSSIIVVILSDSATPPKRSMIARRRWSVTEPLKSPGVNYVFTRMERFKPKDPSRLLRVNSSCTWIARNCTSFRALFCVHMPIVGRHRQDALTKVFDFVDGSGGRTRDRTLDLSRVKGTLSR
jgi:hypothetical protein